MSWETLLTAAMAGTRGQAVVAADEPWGDLPAASPERALLLRAGAWAVYAQAGRLSEPAAPAAAPAPDDRRQPLGRDGLALLRQLLGDGSRRLVAEAFEVMAERGLRLPHAMLPELLSRADEPIREALPAVLGERGIWLSAQRDDWAWAHERAPEPTAWDEATAVEHWEIGTWPERVAALAQARRHAPALALTWLGQAMPKEKADQRVALVQAIAPTVSNADEPWLEGCLSDRSAQVRIEAARLLARLPGSALASRLAARADEVLTGDTLDTAAAAPPQAWPKAWEREGLTEAPPLGLGPRAWWLWQAVAGVSPTHWEARFASTPEAIVARLEADTWAAGLLLGLGEAAVTHGAGPWLGPLLAAHDRLLAAEPGDLVYMLRDHRQRLVDALPADTRVAMATAEFLADAPYAARLLLGTVPPPWPEALAQAYLTGLRRHVAGLPDTPYQHWHDSWYPMVEFARFTLPPSYAEAIAAIAATLAPREHLLPLHRVLDQLAETLTLRQRIQKEITA